MVKKRGGRWYIYFRPFKTELIGVATEARTKGNARELETMIKRACRNWSFEQLDQGALEVVKRIFGSRSWELPQGIECGPALKAVVPKYQLNLWKAAELFLSYPGIRESGQRSHYENSLSKIVDYFGKDFLIERLWIPQIKEYMMMRSKNAAASTVNKEKAALSKMFSVLIELRHFDENPCRLIKNLSEKSGEREVYIGLSDFMAIVERLPEWMRPLIQTLYYTGMRRGEAVNLERGQVDLKKRIIFLGPENTKERDFKRVPIGRAVETILVECMKVRSLGSDNVFLFQGRPFSEDSLRKPWIRALSEIGMEPRPVIHDLRHTFVANCRRSGVSHEIVQAIVGHWNRAKKVSERYGRVSNQELVEAIDRVGWNFGESEIFVSRKKMLTKC